MNKHKLTKSNILNIVIITVLYVTWIVGIHVMIQMSGNEDKHIVYTNLLGSFIALIYAIFLHYPLIPLFSKYINQRTENEAVAIRRNYAIKALYTIVIGFFACAFTMFLGYDKFDEHPLAQSWGIVTICASVMMATFSIFTLQYFKKMKILMYVDKLQHKNADIEG